MPDDITDRVQWRIAELSDKYPELKSALKNLDHEKFRDPEEKRLVKEHLKVWVETGEAILRPPPKKSSNQVSVSVESGSLLSPFVKIKAKFKTRKK